MVPTDRKTFREFCLRNLGWPILEINLDEDHVDDRIDEALQYYRDYHFDGSDKIYYKHQLSQTDITNKYITLPENIFGAVKIFSLTSRVSSISNLFGVQYQLALNELYTFSSYSLIPYYMGMMHLNLIDELLVGEKQIRYSRHRNRLYVDMDWSYIHPNEFLLVEAFEVIDPAIYPDVWGDRWLGKYATQLIKRNWGAVLSKFPGTQLTGGIQFNGQKYFDDADAEIKRLEDEMLNSYSLPSAFILG